MTRSVGIDMGGSTSRIVVGDVRKGAFEIQAAREVDTDDVVDTLAELGAKGARAIVGVTGRDMILRTTQVPPVPAWQLRDLMAFEIDDIAEQSGDALSADFTVLGGAAMHSDEDMVLLALVRSSLVDERSAQLAPGGVKAPSFTPNAIALHNAFVAADGRDGLVMIASIGGSNTDVALVEDGELLFARNLGGGGDAFTTAIANALKLDAAKAENVKLSMARFGGAPGDPHAAQVASALDEALRSVVGALQSSVVMCRTQLQDRGITPDVVLLCGPGAQIDGMDRALAKPLGMPVERFDPTDGYVVGEDVEPLDDGGDAFAVAAGLAMMGALKDSTRLEIVSDATRRAREFGSKTVWLIAAAVLVLANLAVAFVVARGDHAAAEDDAAKLRRAAQSRSRAASEHRRVTAEAREAAAKLAELEAVTAPGAGVVTALDLMSLHLPDELWITSLRTRREGGGAEGAPARTLIAIEGRGKEVGRPLTDAITALTQTLRADPRVHAATTQASTDPRGDFLWDLRLDLTDVPRDVEADDDAEDEDVARGDGTEDRRGS